jgi:hypothetical protein
MGHAGAIITALAAPGLIEEATNATYDGLGTLCLGIAFLFIAAVQLPINPVPQLMAVLADDPERTGQRIVEVFLSVWDHAAERSPLLALIRSAVGDERAAAMLREFITEEVLGQIARRLGSPDARLRATLVGSQVVGLIMLRYIIRVEPLASAPADQVAAAVGPTLQRYLTGDVAAAPARA